MDFIELSLQCIDLLTVIVSTVRVLLLTVCDETISPWTLWPGLLSPKTTCSWSPGAPWTCETVATCCWSSSCGKIYVNKLFENSWVKIRSPNLEIIHFERRQIDCLIYESVMYKSASVCIAKWLMMNKKYVHAIDDNNFQYSILIHTNLWIPIWIIYLAINWSTGFTGARWRPAIPSIILLTFV